MTRFNVRLSFSRSGPDDNWLRSRLALFEKHTLRSVQSQTLPLDHWLIFCDDESPIWFREALSAMLDRPAWQPVWVSGLFTPDAASAAVASRIQRRHVITSRLDNDDVIARPFLEHVQAQFVGQAFQFVNFTHGLQYAGGRIYHRSDPSNAFASLIESVSNGRPRTIFLDGHHRLALHGPVHQVRAEPIWLQLVHGGNVANQIAGVRAHPRLLTPFDAALTVEPVAPLALAMDQALTAARLATRVAAKPHRIRWFLKVLGRRRRSA
jgi:hypothetical protein